MRDASRHPDLVRRNAEPWSEHVHHFLGYLQAVGFEGAPRSLGVVDGREAVSWVDGWVSGVPFDGPLLDSSGLESVGRLLKRFHDAAVGYTPRPDAIWAAGVIPMRKGHIIRHGDIAAGNIVWNFGEATAFIDWEFAQPGYPIEDVALAAWLLGPLVPLDAQIKAGFPTGAPLKPRLEALARGYRAFTLAEILETKLWQPAGFTSDATWGQNTLAPDGHALGHCCLSPTLQDFAHLGPLYLDDFVIDGEQIVPPDWVDSVAQPQVGANYSLQFWLPDGSDQEFMAVGAFSNYLWIDKARGFTVAQFGTPPPRDALSGAEHAAAMRAIGDAVTAGQAG